MSRTLTALVALVALAGLVAQVALGAKPIREPLPNESFTIPASVCGFAIQGETLSGKAKALVFGNRVLVTGKIKVRLTNAGDPTKSLDLNIPGPGVFDENGLRGTGPWLLYFEPDEFGPGSPPLLAFVRGNFSIGASGYELHGGNQIDLCPLLA